MKITCFILALTIFSNIIVTDIAVGSKISKKQNSKLPENVCKAVDSGDLKVVQDYLNNGGNVNAVDEHGLTMIVCAIILIGKTDETLKIIELLINHGASLDHIFPITGETLLTYSIMHGMFEIAEMLVRGDPSLIDKRNKDNNLPINIAEKKRDYFTIGFNSSNIDVRECHKELHLKYSNFVNFLKNFKASVKNSLDLTSLEKNTKDIVLSFLNF